jgi:hypothetical protein
MEHIGVDLQTAAPHPAPRRLVRYYSQRRLAAGENLKEPVTARLGGLARAPLRPCVSNTYLLSRAEQNPFIRTFGDTPERGGLAFKLKSCGDLSAPRMMSRTLVPDATEVALECLKVAGSGQLLMVLRAVRPDSACPGLRHVLRPGAQSIPAQAE